MIQDPSAKAQPNANQITGRIKKFIFIFIYFNVQAWDVTIDVELTLQI